jgi:Ca2+-binding RTX toxin-like protein
MRIGEQGARRLPGGRRRRATAVCVVAGACLLGAVSTASASKLYVDPSGTLRFAASGGEVNRVDATDIGMGGFTVVTDPGSLIHPGPGCVSVTAHQARCALPASGDQDMRIDLSDQDDAAHAIKLGGGSITINGGVGDDTIADLPRFGANVHGGNGDDTITVHPNFGGSADVHGDEGNDRITAISASGVVSGDGNNDVITLSTMVNPPSGPPSAAYGGVGNDRIVANGGTAMGLLDGGDGNDRVSTDEFATAATLDGGAGKDLITTKNLTGGGPFPYAAEILGGAGPDTIDGGGSGDSLDCGPDVDHYKVYLGDTVTGCEIPF